MVSKYEWTCPKWQTFTGDDSDSLEDRAWDHLERVHKDDSVLVRIKRSATNDTVNHTVHEFQPGQASTKWDPIGRKKVASENLNFCKVCGCKKDHILHTKGSKATDSARRAQLHRALDAILEKRANARDMEPGNEAIKRATPDLRREILAAEKRLAVAVSSADAKRLEALLDKLWAKVPVTGKGAKDMRTQPSKLLSNPCPYCDKDHDPNIQCRLMPVSPRARLHRALDAALDGRRAKDDDYDKERRKRAAAAGFGWIPTWDLEEFAKAVGLSTNLKNGPLRDLLAERGYTPADLIAKIGNKPSKRPKGMDKEDAPQAGWRVSVDRIGGGTVEGPAPRMNGIGGVFLVKMDKGGTLRVHKDRMRRTQAAKDADLTPVPVGDSERGEYAANNWSAKLLPVIKERLRKASKESRGKYYDARVERRYEEMLAQAEKAVAGLRAANGEREFNRHANALLFMERGLR